MPSFSTSLPVSALFSCPSEELLAAAGVWSSSLSWLHEFISLHGGMRCGIQPGSHMLSTETTNRDDFDTFFNGNWGWWTCPHVDLERIHTPHLTFPVFFRIQRLVRIILKPFISFNYFLNKFAIWAQLSHTLNFNALCWGHGVRVGELMAGEYRVEVGVSGTRQVRGS